MRAKEYRNEAFGLLREAREDLDSMLSHYMDIFRLNYPTGKRPVTKGRYVFWGPSPEHKKGEKWHIPRLDMGSLFDLLRPMIADAKSFNTSDNWDDDNVDSAFNSVPAFQLTDSEGNSYFFRRGRGKISENTILLADSGPLRQAAVASRELGKLNRCYRSATRDKRRGSFCLDRVYGWHDIGGSTWRVEVETAGIGPHKAGPLIRATQEYTNEEVGRAFSPENRKRMEEALRGRLKDLFGVNRDMAELSKRMLDVTKTEMGHVKY